MSAIRAAAAALAEAKVEAEQSAVVLKDANSAVSEIRERLDALENERSEIVAARKAGDVHNGNDGARLQEIAADSEGLKEIYAERSAIHAAAAAVSAAHSQAITAAESSLAHATNQAMLADLKVVASDLDQRLLSTIVEMSAVAKRLGMSRAPWIPTSLLANYLRRLELEGASR
jgi:hypothetical protein